MLSLALSLVILFFFIAKAFFLRDLPQRLFFLIFTISTIYYGILGPWYWMEFHDSVFLGVNWKAYIPLSVLMFVVVHFIVMSAFSMAPSGGRGEYWIDYPWSLKTIRFPLFIFCLVGLISCIYVYFIGSALVEKNAHTTDDSLLLIFFQLSDILIGALFFWLATYGLNRKWLVLAFIFVLYAFISGFRSKILLFLGPLLIYAFLTIENNKTLYRVTLTILSAFVVALFSTMTIARVKFSGIDINLLRDLNSSAYLYGFFAETNILFGLSSTLKIFGDTVPFAGLTPLIESITQFMPRAFFPDKDLYRHLKDAAWWIGNSQEALDSGTAMPFFGEYYAAFGWFGVVTLTFLYAIIVLQLTRIIRKYSVTKKQYLMGSALIAVFFGYYYFSRGSIAQITKGFIFAIGPYLYLLRIQWKNRSFNKKSRNNQMHGQVMQTLHQGIK